MNPLRPLFCCLIGAAIATLHAGYLGYSAPIPAACRAGVPYEFQDNSSIWIVVPATSVGLQQYDLTAKPDGWPHRLGTGPLPDWVWRPAPGESSISRGFGWPLAALSGTEIYASSRLTSVPGYYTLDDGTLIPTQLRTGLLLNSIVFGLAALVVWSIGAHLMRAIRRRGHPTSACPTCGYDGSGLPHDVCPECGASLKPRDAGTAEMPK